MDDDKNMIYPIYEKVKDGEGIRQGDVFRGIPKLNFTPEQDFNGTILDVGGSVRKEWSRLVDSNEPTKTPIIMEPTIGIVLTQDCDVTRNVRITLLEITENKLHSSYIDEKLEEAKNKGKRGKTEKNVVKSYFNRLKEAFDGPKMMYLPKDIPPEGGSRVFKKNMQIMFESVLYIGSEQLKTMTSKFRLFRLNETALDHFRQKINAYFLRYAVNMHYVMDNREYNFYKYMYHTEEKERNEIHPYQPYQQDEDPRTKEEKSASK